MRIRISTRIRTSLGIIILVLFPNVDNKAP